MKNHLDKKENYLKNNPFFGKKKKINKKKIIGGTKPKK